MSSIIETLYEINPTILRDIDQSFSSIYKVNKKHHIFISLLEKNPVLIDAEYIVYPNINNVINTIFLDNSGKEVLVYNEGVSEFILLPSDFEVNLASMQVDNPYHQNFSL